MGRRAAIIVQNDNFNASHIMTTIVVHLTTNTMLADYKDNILLSAKTTKLSKDSIALTPQVGSVDKSCLVEKVSKLPPSKIVELSQALADLLSV